MMSNSVHLAWVAVTALLATGCGDKPCGEFKELPSTDALPKHLADLPAVPDGA